jgi:predicted glutamine amidotransferase
MCRFTLYLGPAVQLSTLLVDPKHSLIHQSYQSEERSEPLNGDGFGVGWYAPRLTPEPAVFHSISPAWNNRNLRSLCRVVASPCILAHVRAATTGSDVNLANCHPFQHGRHLLMHNGHIGAFRAVRRRLLESLCDEAFDGVKGSTDTEHLFAVFVDETVRNGHPHEDPGDAALVLAQRLSAAMQRVLALVAQSGAAEPSFLNVAVSDGEHAVVSRFANDPDEGPESLYIHRGELYEPTCRRFSQRRGGDEGEAVLVSSERLTDAHAWTEVPPNHLVVLDRRLPPRILPLAPDGSLRP